MIFEFVPMINEPPQTMLIASSSAAVEKNKRMVLGVCEPIPKNDGHISIADNLSSFSLFPVETALNYPDFFSSESKLMTADDFNRFVISSGQSAKITILKKPDHGKITGDGFFGEGYVYIPDVGYEGKDKIVVQVEISGYTVKLIEYIQVGMGKVGNFWETELCGDRGYMWKISSRSGATQQFNTVAAMSWLSPNQSNFTVTYRDIPGQSE